MDIKLKGPYRKTVSIGEIRIDRTRDLKVSFLKIKHGSIHNHKNSDRFDEANPFQKVQVP